MGRDVPKTQFDDQDRRRFAERLQLDLAALKELLARPDFGQGGTTIGAELEMQLIDGAGRPLPVSEAILDDAPPELGHELARFNLEMNVRPVPLRGRPFTVLAAALAETLAAAREAAAEQGGDVSVIGILPTLRQEDLQRQGLSRARRYRALSAALRRCKGDLVHCRIDGEEPLAATFDDITLEGANTSFQVHLRVTPEDYAATMNASQLAVAPVLAAAANAPLFLGHRLWDETRIALFWQAFDDRPGDGTGTFRPRRVAFGQGWTWRGAHELFAECVALHAPLLPVLSGGADPVGIVRAGGVPPLDELRLHSGTVWRWHRPVYDPEAGGHLRIELRALPAGPTIVDMTANAAFLLGLTLALRGEVEDLLPGMPFPHALRNFYEAARLGLDATLLWPDRGAPSPRPVKAGELIGRLLPLARSGLVGAGVAPEEADDRLRIIEARVAAGITGARWQRRCLAELERRAARPEAAAAMLARYQDLSRSGRPVHEWPRA